MDFFLGGWVAKPKSMARPQPSDRTNMLYPRLHTFDHRFMPLDVCPIESIEHKTRSHPTPTCMGHPTDTSAFISSQMSYTGNDNARRERQLLPVCSSQMVPVLVVAPQGHDGDATTAAAAGAEGGGGGGRPSTNSMTTPVAAFTTPPPTVALPAHRRRPRFFALFGPMRYVQRAASTARPMHALPVLPAAAEDSESEGARKQRPQHAGNAGNAETEAWWATLMAGKASATSFSSSVKVEGGGGGCIYAHTSIIGSCPIQTYRFTVPLPPNSPQIRAGARAAALALGAPPLPGLHPPVHWRLLW